MFDAFMSSVAGDDLRAAAESLTSRPPRYVVLSHWHNDHIRGAQSFTGSTTIASTRTRELIALREPPEIGAEKRNVSSRLERARQRLSGETDATRLPERRFWLSYYEAMQHSHPLLRLTLPVLTFEKELIIHGSARDEHIIDLEGHTGSDSIVWLPRERLALMGDLLFVGHHPYLPDGNPDEHATRCARRSRSARSIFCRAMGRSADRNQPKR